MIRPVAGRLVVSIFLRTLQENGMHYGWSPGSDGLPSERCRRMVYHVAGRLGVSVFFRTLQENGMPCGWSPSSDGLPSDAAGEWYAVWQDA